MNESFNLALFDLDGTVTDSASGIFASFEHALAQYGVAFDRAKGRHVLGPSLRDSFAHYVSAENIEPAIAAYRAYYNPKGMFDAQVYPGVVQMLATLRAAGYSTALATSKPEAFARLILKHFGLDILFDFVGGASFDRSRDTKASVIEYVLSQPRFFGKKPVMIGDRNNDMQGAAVCGVPAVGVLYGYGSKEELEPLHPLYLAQDTAQLRAWLVQHFDG